MNINYIENLAFDTIKNILIDKIGIRYNQTEELQLQQLLYHYRPLFGNILNIYDKERKDQEFAAIIQNILVEHYPSVLTTQVNNGDQVQTLINNGEIRKKYQNNQIERTILPQNILYPNESTLILKQILEHLKLSKSGIDAASDNVYTVVIESRYRIRDNIHNAFNFRLELKKGQDEIGALNVPNSFGEIASIMWVSGYISNIDKPIPETYPKSVRVVINTLKDKNRCYMSPSNDKDIIFECMLEKDSANQNITRMIPDNYRINYKTPISTNVLDLMVTDTNNVPIIAEKDFYNIESIERIEDPLDNVTIVTKITLTEEGDFPGDLTLYFSNVTLVNGSIDTAINRDSGYIGKIGTEGGKTTIIIPHAAPEGTLWLGNTGSVYVGDVFLKLTLQIVTINNYVI